jgi:hypothetical protein
MTAPKYANSTAQGRTYDDLPGAEGLHLPSVTTILGTLSKPALVPWAANMTAECAMTERGLLDAMEREEGIDAALAYLRGASTRSRDAAADLGTRVHAACEMWPLGDEWDDDVRPHADAFVKWMGDTKPEFLRQEMTVYSLGDLPYAGTLDMVVRIDGRIYVGDIKTGSAAKRAYPDTALQLYAYATASREVSDGDWKVPDWTADGGFILGLTPKGYKVHFCRFDDALADAWDATLRLHRWRSNTKGVFSGEAR